MCESITRLACKFKPPSISIEYLDASNTKKYQQFEVMFAKFSEPHALFKTLTTDYASYFNENTIPLRKLMHFIRDIIKRAPSIDLTEQPRETIEKFKVQMNKEFELNQIKPGDPGYQYDLQEDFGDPEEPCEWDD